MASNKFTPIYESFKLKGVRLCYVHLRTPSSIKQDDGSQSPPKYSVMALIPKDSDQLSELEDLVYGMAEESFGDKAEALMERGKLNNPLRDGDIEKEADDPVFSGHYFMSVKTSPRGYTRGSTIDYSNPKDFSSYPGPSLAYMSEGVVVKVGDDEFDFNEIYSGCYASVSASMATYSHSSGGKGVTCYLKAVLKTADGEPLDGNAPAVIENEFEDELKELLGAPSAEKNGGKKRRGRKAKAEVEEEPETVVEEEPQAVVEPDDLDVEEEEAPVAKSSRARSQAKRSPRTRRG